MKINNDWEVFTDNLGTYVVRQYYTSKVGTRTFKETYHPTLHHVYNYCLKMEVAKYDLVDIKKVMDKMDELTKDFKKFVKDIDNKEVV